MAEQKPTKVDRRKRTSPNSVDMTGRRYGRLLVLSRAETIKGLSRWLCRCDCGVERVVRGADLRNGSTRSCWCLGRENVIAACSTHRGSRTQLYNAWTCMRARCENPKNSNFRYYGGRGVRVCERWLKFENFLADMGERPKGCTLDRIDGNGDYEPGNCRWATPTEQANNMRSNRNVTVDGETFTIAQWAKRTGLNKHLISERLRSGWSPSEAVSTPPQTVPSRNARGQLVNDARIALKLLNDGVVAE